MQLKKILSAVGCFFLAQSAFADFDAGLAAFNKRDYNKAIQEFEPLAKAGDSKATFFFAAATLYLHPPKDIAESAWVLMYKSANDGYPPAQYYIANDVLRHANADTRKKFFDRALKFLQLAVEKKYAPAQYLLSDLMRRGEGVEKSQTLANDLLEASAKQNYFEATSLLGIFIYTGNEGWKEDRVLGSKLIIRAANDGDIKSFGLAGLILLTGIDGNQVDEDKGSQFLFNGALYKDYLSMMFLASIYAGDYKQVTRIKPNLVAAYTWLLLAEQYNNGVLSEQGKRIQSRISAKLDESSKQEAAQRAKVLKERIDASQSSNHSFQQDSKQAPQKSSGTPKLAGFGSGFAISDQGHIVTNNHVIEGCRALNIPAINQRAEVVNIDKKTDLALLRVQTTFKNYVTVRSLQTPVDLGEDLVVLGFPLPVKLSSSIKVTTGTLSAFGGYNNNSTLYQISAPVQAGNSGGPVFDLYGHVIAVVVSQLKFDEDAPQNVNFAINTPTLINFLNANHIKYKVASNGKNNVLKVSEVTAQNKDHTFMIECYK